MIRLVAMVAFQCRRQRPLVRDAALIEATVRGCTESITNLLHRYGGVRVIKLMHSTVRQREFICSMLYIMRVGITYQNRQILPRVDSLHQLLLMQALLPSVFKIRAKSITEGEVMGLIISSAACSLMTSYAQNLMKMDIKKLPL